MKSILFASVAALALVACSGVYGPNDERVVRAVPSHCLASGVLPASDPSAPDCAPASGEKRVGSLIVRQ